MNRAILELRKCLEARGLSQNAAAAAVGADPGNFSRLMRGERGLSLPLALAIEREFGVLAAWWSEKVEPEHKPTRTERKAVRR